MGAEQSFTEDDAANDQRCSESKMAPVVFPMPMVLPFTENNNNSQQKLTAPSRSNRLNTNHSSSHRDGLTPAAVSRLPDQFTSLPDQSKLMDRFLKDSAKHVRRGPPPLR